jgi:hypothetical protein
MKTPSLLCVAMLLLGLGRLHGQTAAPETKVSPLPPGIEQAKPQTSPEKAVAALHTIRKALDDLPPGRERDQLTELLDRIQQQVAEGLKGQVMIAQADLQMWLDRAAWSKRMFAKGFVARSQADADQARLEAAQVALARVQKLLEGLQKDRERPEQKRPKQAGRTQWEYKVLTRDELLRMGKEDRNLTPALNLLGAEGWELVCIEPTHYGPNMVVLVPAMYYFKRVK